MRYRVWTLALMLIALCASSLYAVRVYAVSYGHPVSTRMLHLVSPTILLAIVGLSITKSVKRLNLGIVVATLGCLLILSSVAYEMSTGVAETVMLEPEEKGELSFAAVHLTKFEAWFEEGGELADCRSDLYIDFDGYSETLGVATGKSAITRGISVFQLGIGRSKSEEGSRLYSKLGFLKESSTWPFRGGLALFDIGVLMLVLFKKGESSVLTGTF